MRTFFFFLLILSAGCRHTDPDLENALRQAGENRSQLEQVLDHYRNDSLKYKAACFLIANMPGHYSILSDELSNYKQHLLQYDAYLKALADPKYKYNQRR